MLSMTGTLRGGPRAIFLADCAGLPVQTDCGKSPRSDRHEPSELWLAELSVSLDCSLMRPLQSPSFQLFALPDSKDGRSSAAL